MGRSGPECRWWRGRRAHPAASRAQLRMEGCGGEWFGVPVPRLFLCVGALQPNCRQCTSSVRVQRPISGAPQRNGCSAPYRVQRPISGAVPPCLWRLSGLWGSSGLGLSSAWAVFCLGHFVVPLWHLMLWFLRNVARNSPTCISNIEIASLELQRFGALHKVRVPELRASFG